MNTNDQMTCIYCAGNFENAVDYHDHMVLYHSDSRIYPMDPIDPIDPIDSNINNSQQSMDTYYESDTDNEIDYGNSDDDTDYNSNIDNNEISDYISNTDNEENVNITVINTEINLNIISGIPGITERNMKNHPEGEDEKSHENNPKCVVCIENKACIVNIDCGHLCLCIGCSKQLYKKWGGCPTCRKPLENLLKVFY